MRVVVKDLGPDSVETVEGRYEIVVHRGGGQWGTGLRFHNLTRANRVANLAQGMVNEEIPTRERKMDRLVNA
jgi:hypothetical protein